MAWEGGLLILKLYFASDIYVMEKTYKKPSLEKDGIDAVKTLLNKIRAPFDLSAYKNEYQDRLRAASSSPS